MKFLLVALLGLSTFLSANWLSDFEKAKQEAQTEHKYILLNFSGSDWCGPCIRLRKDIFDSESFSRYASEHLILVNADFPRSKKHALSADQQKKNDQLAEQFNKQGVFPLTLLLTPGGDIVKTWEGLPPVSAEAFTKEVQDLVDAAK